jgi:molybdopterin synthase sulfur carrier subunit
MSDEAGTVTVRLFAAAREAAGARELYLPAGPLDEVLSALRHDRSARFRDVLALCSLVCDGVRLDPQGISVLRPGAVLDVLPPFAGG